MSPPAQADLTVGNNILGIRTNFCWDLLRYLDL